ncbi:hypothetical protein E2542_SST25293 [Spatholobus suberectus]|nr:hypothetical protein E2542_SST25293 [Spatholobus suberectus]
MATRRGGGDDGATLRPRPLSSSRRFPSPSLQKENTNPRGSTCRSNPKTLPRGRSSSPSDLPRHRPNPAQKPTRDPTPKPKPKPTAAQKPKPSTTSKNSQDTTTTANDNNDNNTNAKYPSRLHEKLAFLEGKVKRIASDIKKTKEMLDMNNPDASKVILSDIHDKISGIEKAMVHVVSNQNDTAVEGVKDKSLANGEELEARLFPHQKLLRDRAVVKDGDSAVEDKVLSPAGDNSVAVEFLALIGEDAGKVSAGEEAKEKGGGNGGWSDQKCDIDAMLAADEKLEEFDDDQENREGAAVEEEMDEAFNFRLNEIGSKVALAGGSCRKARLSSLLTMMVLVPIMILPIVRKKLYICRPQKFHLIYGEIVG